MSNCLLISTIIIGASARISTPAPEQHLAGHHELCDTNVLPQNAHEVQQHFPCCGICGKTFDTTGNLMIHMDSEHRPSTAHMTVGSSNQLEQETSSHVPVSQLQPLACLPMSFYCQLCEYTFLTAAELREHMAVTHSSDSASDTLQQMSIMQPWSHLETTTCYTELHCNQCDLTFNNMRLLNLHIREQHISVYANCDHPSNDQCEICSTTSLSSHEISTHSENNTPPAKQKQSFSAEIHCQYCDSTFQTMSSLNIHVRYYHTPEHVKAVTSSTPKPSECRIAQIDGNDSLTNTSEDLSFPTNLT